MPRFFTRKSTIKGGSDMRSRRSKNKKQRKLWKYVVTAMISLTLVSSIIFIILQKNGLLPSQGAKPKEAIPQVIINKPLEPEVPTEPVEPATDNGYIEGQTLPTEPTYIKGILLANKRYPLPASFAPGEQAEAIEAMDQLLGDAKKAGFNLNAFSGYRSYEYQKTLYDNYVARDGKDAADRYSARPGYSEHQTGLVYDVGEVGNEAIWLTEKFGESEAGIWIRDNAHRYGFIMRYPKGKEEITGYMYESWHFRYVGVEVATEIAKTNSTLEEYLGVNP